MTRKVRIDLSELRKPADIAVKRASVFLGLAHNAADLKPPLSHVLEGKVQFGFVPDEVAEGTSKHFVEEFSYWVTGNALRELVESLSVVLTNCRPLIHLLQEKQYEPPKLEELSKDIESKNISQQYAEIQALIELDEKYGEMLESFRVARNCLAHRRGVVARRDLNTPDEHLKTRWCFMAPHLQALDGTTTLIDHDALSKGMEPVEEEQSIILKLAWKSKSFPLGSQIRLSRHDLAEICFGMHLATPHIMKKMHDFARAQGVPDEELDDIKDVAPEAPPPPKTPENLDQDTDT